MKRNAPLLGAVATVAAVAALVTLAVFFAPAAVGQRQEATKEATKEARKEVQPIGERTKKEDAARILLKNGTALYIFEPRTKLIAGQTFFGGIDINPAVRQPNERRQWVPLSEVARIEEYDHVQHLGQAYRLENPAVDQKK
jgi:hypothetical protein